MSRDDFERAIGLVRQLLEPHIEAGTPMALRAEREAIPLEPRPIFEGAKATCRRCRKGKLFILFEVADSGGMP